MQELKKYFKLLLLLSMFLSLPLFAKKALMPIVMDDIVVMVSYTIPKPVPSPNTGRVKKTGQIKSYDEDGNIVTDGSIKDDGYYQRGIAPNFTRNNTAEIVTDHLTGLQWQDNIESKTITKNWADALTYCSSLSLDGDGWRLPTVQELHSIVVDGRYNPSIDSTYFVNYYVYTENYPGYYWSSTTTAFYTFAARVVNFYSGSASYSDKTYTHYVRCVR